MYINFCKIGLYYTYTLYNSVHITYNKVQWKQTTETGMNHISCACVHDEHTCRIPAPISIQKKTNRLHVCMCVSIGCE